MNNLVIMKNKQAVTSSLQVAKTFEKNHRDVLRAIDNLEIGSAKLRSQMFAEGTYTNRGKEYPMYYMNRDGFTLLAMGFTGKEATKFKLQYIDAFNAMERQAKQQVALPQTPEEKIMLLLQNANEGNKKINQIDNRVRDLEHNKPLVPGEYNYISHAVGGAVNTYVQTHHLILTAKQRGKLYKDINGGIKQIAGIQTRAQLREKDFENVDRYIRNWVPSTATILIIKQLSEPVASNES